MTEVEIHPPRLWHPSRGEEIQLPLLVPHFPLNEGNFSHITVSFPLVEGVRGSRFKTKLTLDVLNCIDERELWVWYIFPRNNMSEVQKSFWESDQELTQEAQQHLANLEALVRFRELHPEIFATIAPKVKAVLTEGESPIIPVLSEEAMKEQILTKPRNNKYGLVMDPLEQELENIKLGFLKIEMYQGSVYIHPDYGKESPREFFERVYSRFWSEPKTGEYSGIIYQNDLMLIDQKLLNDIRNDFSRKLKRNIKDYLPNRTHRTQKLLKSMTDGYFIKDDLNWLAQSLFRKYK